LWTVKSFLFSIFGLSNIYFYKHIDDFNYFDFENTTPFLHTWSLGIEEQFYITFPFLLIIFFKSKLNYIFLKQLFLFLAFISLFFFLDDKNFLNHYYLLSSRAWEILFGAIFFLYKNREELKIKIPKFSIIFFILILLFIFIVFSLVEEKIDYRHQVLATLIFLIIFVTFIKSNNFFLEKYFIYLGKLSYSLYLWHFPLIYFSSYYLTGYSKYFFVIIITFFLSYISYNYIEIPFRKINLSLNKIKGIFFSIISIFIILFLFHNLNLINIRNIIHHNIVKTNHIFKNINFTKKTIEYRVANKHFLNNDKCNILNENFTNQNYLNCIVHKNNNNLFYITGDSFGEHFLNILSSSSSKIFDNIYLGKVENYNFQSIKNFNELSKKFDKSFFIFSISYQENINIDKLIEYFRKLKDHNVIIIKPHQRTNKFIHDCIEHVHLKIFSSYINKDKCEYDKYLDQNRIDVVNQKLYKLSQLFSNIKLFDFNHLICKTKKCNLYNEENNLIYFTDNTHLTFEFAELISPLFEKWFKNEYFENIQEN